jgi:hypothetical protein
MNNVRIYLSYWLRSGKKLIKLILIWLTLFALVSIPSAKLYFSKVDSCISGCKAKGAVSGIFRLGYISRTTGVANFSSCTCVYQ